MLPLSIFTFYMCKCEHISHEASDLSALLGVLKEASSLPLTPVNGSLHGAEIFKPAVQPLDRPVSPSGPLWNLLLLPILLLHHFEFSWLFSH